MKKSIILNIGFFTFLCLQIFSANLFSQTQSEFNAPWNNIETPIVIDAYHYNSIDWAEMSKDKRVVGVIHKATEGETFADSKYDLRKQIAKNLGYKWGSYHLLHTGNIIQQADFYLSKIGKNNPDEIMAVDVECSIKSDCKTAKYKVSAEEIKTFIKHIKKETGRYPILYANHSVVRYLSNNFKDDELLNKIPLWYARFKSNVTDFPKGIWNSYTFWQFSSEINCKVGKRCLYRVQGTKSDMDINVFNGTIDELKANWENIGK